MTSPTGASEPRDVEELARLADGVASAVIGCSGVAGLWQGPVATYLPHRTVPGVALRDGEVSVSVVARYGHRLTEVADEVRAAVRRAAPGRRVDVHIEDIEIPTVQEG